ncbi:4a-hydroxytetrahydrobiopterin dehydratase [Melioribacteraceae bacterium 4301-Me]|uniref:4a-hydroxytetrahydrobiopterin dehydratase n=1 Tax=Pyranulibacter aquaticus TaxID=3163344 RepID=UPI0035978603
MKVLSEKELKEKLKLLNGWDYFNGSLQKEFTKINFVDALTFILKIGFEAEKLDHHPDLQLHSWNKVKVILSTHSAGGVTENDFKLAEIIEKI